MKWENRDIHVVEQANIPKFSRLDDIETPFRLFESFSHDALLDMVVGYTKLFGHTEKADTSFEITNETFCLFLGMLLLSGCHKPPDRKMYWETPPIVLFKQCLIQCLVIRLSVFFKISILGTMNNLIRKTKSKLRPVI